MIKDLIEAELSVNVILVNYKGIVIRNTVHSKELFEQTYEKFINENCIVTMKDLESLRCEL